MKINSAKLGLLFILCVLAHSCNVLGMQFNEEAFSEYRFFQACKTGDIEKVRFFVGLKQCKVDFRYYDNEQWLTPLFIACFQGHIEVAKLLLEQKNSDVNMKSQANYCYIFSKRDYKEYRFVPYRIADFTPLYIAVRFGYKDIVKLLLAQKDIDVNFGGGDDTPLAIACKWGRCEIVQVLLAHKNIDVNLENRVLQTSLGLACIRNDLELVKLLLQHRDIDVNKKSAISGGENIHYPLMLALSLSNQEIVKILLLQGVKLVKPISRDQRYDFIKTLLSFIKKKKFIFKKTKDLTLQKREVFDFLVSYYFAKSIQIYLKNENALFEETPFCKIYKYCKKNDLLSVIDFKKSLGVDHRRINYLGSYFYFKKLRGDTHFYFDESVLEPLLVKCEVAERDRLTKLKTSFRNNKNMVTIVCVK